MSRQIVLSTAPRQPSWDIRRGISLNGQVLAEVFQNSIKQTVESENNIA
jgi:hypothetical protein